MANLLNPLDVFRGKTIRVIASGGNANYADVVRIFFTDGTSLMLSSSEGISLNSKELQEVQRIEHEKQKTERLEAELKRDAELKEKYPGIT